MMRYKLFGDRAVLIEWPTAQDDLLATMVAIKQQLETVFLWKIDEVVLSYQSLLVVFEKSIVVERELMDSVKKCCEVCETSVVLSKRHWDIPVCYDPIFGVDLREASNLLGLSIDTIVQLHSEVTYQVRFIGFLPGFLYLEGLDEQLAMPRRATPRTKVPKGAVGIGGNQTGMYPSESPGGWQLIGRTPVSLFNPKVDPPCFCRPGDTIRMKPVTLAEYGQLEKRWLETPLDCLNSMRYD